ncbi:hypothetical protein [Tuberibacillus sp. Marseille-P3662]|uniref:hypothetical protein n=1 Tax=Tuberibacillus sp. Marseille-P3662 TaxID=1965358 RepID=UPI000A1CBCDE|nr:hypothetical protein [Tuberibacillus sp. Marseille-P3662]
MRVSVERRHGKRWMITRWHGTKLTEYLGKRWYGRKYEIETYNTKGLPDRVETFRVLKGPFRIRRTMRAVNRNFEKIKHRYREWGIPDSQIKFPWKKRG